MAAARDPSKIAYRAVLLAALLVVLGMLFQELVTLLLAVLMTILMAIPLAVVTTRLQRSGVPRPVGALIGLALGFLVLAAIVSLILPPFVDQTQRFVDNVPAIVQDLERDVGHLTGNEPSEVGERVQAFLRKYERDPLRLVRPVAAVGADVAGVLAALVLMVMVAYFMASRPDPLLDGTLRLLPPSMRPWGWTVMRRLREAWIGWLRGVAVDMAVSGVLLYIGLRLIGLEFALLFAVFSALLVVVPYFGAIASGIPPVLFALTESPELALLTVGVYVTVQMIEGNVIVPLVMARTVRLHPAVIAIGVVVVGQLFGAVGLLVAVPLISSVVILVEELWVRPMESAAETDAAPELQLSGLDIGNR